MLTCLRVRNFAIIDELEVEFGNGLNMVTGETGAGKSILVAALQLVLGGRGRPDVVRTGATSAEVEALFDVTEGSELARLLQEAALSAGDELVVRRVVQATGRTRAYINGHMVSATQLTQLAAGIADISSQHEHHTLVDARTHLGYLDAFAALGKARQTMRAAYDDLTAANARLIACIERTKSRGEREDLLRFQVDEINAFGPQLGEEETLQNERERLRHAETLASIAGNAEDSLYASDDALCAQLSRTAVEVRRGVSFDPSLGALADQLESALAQLEESAVDLGRYARDVCFNPERLMEIDDRLDLLGRLKRKYGGSVEQMLEHHRQAVEELSELDGLGEQRDQRQAERDALLAAVCKTALSLRKKRQKAAKKLGKAIAKELASLGMGGAEVVVALVALAPANTSASTDKALEALKALEVDGARLSATGIDRAEFLIAPNKGENAQPLANVASGGELSRAMLAIKRVLADLGPAGLYVFDEVDSGVGGAVAEVIGQKLVEVAKHNQVLCITHLPQIAIYGDAHYRVHKTVIGERTLSHMEQLNKKDRLEEVARMLGGVTITKATRAAAKEMLSLARKASSS